MTTNPLWDLIQEHMDNPAHRYGPTQADLARETGLSEQVLSKWKNGLVLPMPHQLMAFAIGTGVPYERLMEAALRGKGYLPDGVRLRLVSEIGTGARQVVKVGSKFLALPLSSEDVAVQRRVTEALVDTPTPERHEPEPPVEDAPGELA